MWGRARHGVVGAYGTVCTPSLVNVFCFVVGLEPLATAVEPGSELDVVTSCFYKYCSSGAQIRDVS